MREKLNIRGKTLRTDRQSENGSEGGVYDEKMRRVRRVVRSQALLAGGTLLVVVILIFAMTAAWYTNVSRTSTLTFKAESWGFDPDNITVGTAAIGAAPGRSGIVPIEIDNSKSADPVKIYVNVSKSEMSEELKRRIFFYADTSEEISGEMVSRVYVGALRDGAYAYDILPGQKLVMSDDFCSDVPLKWRWVYDMEGYYFRGTVNNVSATAEEYIRPVEYDLDRATFEKTNGVPTGAPVTIYGKSVAEFLDDVSSRDGYEGRVDASDARVIGSSSYYPVKVDENGSGIWLYLCSYAEIDQGISYDTNLGENTEFEAKITVTAVSVPSEVKNVSSAAELASALNDPEVNSVKLSSDIEIPSAVTLAAGADTTLDLGGNRITYTGGETEYSMIVASEGSKLNVIGGEIAGNGNSSGVGGTVDSIAVESVGAEVSLSGVTVSGFDTAVCVSDNDGTGADSILRLTDCELDMQNLGVFIKGNGSASEAHTTVIIDNCKINGETYAGISGQGATDLWGVDLVVRNSEISGYYTSVYLPARDTGAYIKDSTLSGITGIVVKGGTVIIDGCSVTGNGAHVAAAASGGGWTDTGDGVYVEAVYNWNADVTVKNSTVNSTYAYAVELFGKAGSGSGRIALEGGSYAGGAGGANWNSIGTFTVKGCTFSGSVPGDVTRLDG